MTDQLSADLQSLRIPRNGVPAPSRWRSRNYARAAMVLAALTACGVVVKKVVIPLAEGTLLRPTITATEIATVSPTPASVDLSATGYVVPETVAKVGAKVVGRVAEVRIKEGETAKKGAPLFVLDPMTEKSAIDGAHARVLAARARLQTARASLAEVRLQWQREKTLVASGALAASRAEDLRARVAVVDAQARAAAADVNTIEADENGLRTNLSDLTVLAPIDGRAVTKPVQVGDIVDPNRTLVELADFESFRVEADVTEARMGLIHPGYPCELILDAFPTKRYRGEVVEVAPRVNRAKATGVVKVKFVDPPDSVLPDMAVRVSFLAKALDEAARSAVAQSVIPSSAVVERDGAKFAFVLDNGKVHKARLVLGDAVGGGFEVKEGPASGTRVVSDPPANLADGQAVKESQNP